MNRDIVKTFLAVLCVVLAFVFIRKVMTPDEGYQIIGAAAVAVGLGAMLL